MNKNQTKQMKFTKFILPLAALILMAIPLTAMAKETPTAKKPFIAVQELTTDKGINVWFVEDNSVPVLALNFFFADIGAAYETADKQGLARLVSNTLDEGAGEYNAQAFQKALSDHSISLSFGSTRDHFSGELKTLTRYQDKAFELLKLALNNPRFDDEALERMKAANIARIKSSLGKPGWAAARLFNDVLYGGHPYAQNSGGTITTLNALTSDDLKNYVETNFTRDRLNVAVTGSIKAEALVKIIDDIFGGLPEKRQEAHIMVEKFTWPEQGKSALYMMDGLPQSKVTIALPSVALDDPRYYTMKLLTTILGGSGFGSRLMEEIREKHGLTYGIYSHLSSGVAVNMLQIDSTSQNETLAELLKRTMDEVKRIATEAVEETELNAHRDFLIGSMPLSLTSTDRIAGLIQYLQMQGLPSNYFDARADKLRAVTVEDIQALAAELFDPSKAITVVAGGADNESLNTDEIPLADFVQIDTLPNVE